MRIWPAMLIRTFSMLNIFLVLTGLFFLLQTALFFAARVPRPDDPASFAEAYYVRTVINVFCLLILLLASKPLWQLEPRGLRICNLVFAFEIAYFVTSAALGLSLELSDGGTRSQIAASIAATGGIGNMGLSLQLITGYPVVGLIVLNIAYRKLNKRTVGQSGEG